MSGNNYGDWRPDSTHSFFPPPTNYFGGGQQSAQHLQQGQGQSSASSSSSPAFPFLPNITPTQLAANFFPGFPPPSQPFGMQMPQQQQHLSRFTELDQSHSEFQPHHQQQQQQQQQHAQQPHSPAESNSSRPSTSASQRLQSSGMSLLASQIDQRSSASPAAAGSSTASLSTTAAAASQAGEAKKKRAYRCRGIHACLTCKARKVKCDQQYPKCGKCEKGGRNCVYDLSLRREALPHVQAKAAKAALKHHPLKEKTSKPKSSAAADETEKKDEDDSSSQSPLPSEAQNQQQDLGSSSQQLHQPQAGSLSSSSLAPYSNYPTHLTGQSTRSPGSLYDYQTQLLASTNQQQAATFFGGMSSTAASSPNIGGGNGSFFPPVQPTTNYRSPSPPQIPSELLNRLTMYSTPDVLVSLLPRTEHRFLLHHYLTSGIKTLLALGNGIEPEKSPWKTIHLPAVLEKQLFRNERPTQVELYERSVADGGGALRSLPRASCSFTFTALLSVSAIHLSWLKQSPEMAVLSNDLKQQALDEILSESLITRTGLRTRDEVECVLAALISLMSRDILACDLNWQRGVDLACSLVIREGGPAQMLETSSNKSRTRFLLEQLTVREIAASLSTETSPKLIGNGWSSWWYEVGEWGNSEQEWESVENAFGFSRGIADLIARVSGLVSQSRQAKDGKEQYMAEGEALKAEINIWKQTLNCKPRSHPRVQCGDLAWRYAMEIHLLRNVFDVSADDETVSQAVSSVLEICAESSARKFFVWYGWPLLIAGAACVGPNRDWFLSLIQSYQIEAGQQLVLVQAVVQEAWRSERPWQDIIKDQKLWFIV